MFLGAIATGAYRPDLTANTIIGGGLFAIYYVFFMVALEWSAPGYIGRVWYLGDLSGLLIHGVPLDEPLFGFAFGMYWSRVYEHLAWRRSGRDLACGKRPAHNS